MTLLTVHEYKRLTWMAQFWTRIYATAWQARMIREVGYPWCWN